MITWMLSIIDETMKLVKRIFLTKAISERRTSRRILTMMMASTTLRMRLRVKTSWRTWSRITGSRMNWITTKMLVWTMNSKKNSPWTKGWLLINSWIKINKLEIEAEEDLELCLMEMMMRIWTKTRWMPWEGEECVRWGKVIWMMMPWIWTRITIFFRTLSITMMSRDQSPNGSPKRKS